MTGFCLIVAISLGANPAKDERAKGLKAELLVDATEVLVGDLVVTKLRVVNQDQVPLLLWSEDLARSGYATYEFRRDDGKWQDYRLFQENVVCIIRGDYSKILAPKDCQSELMTWDRKDDRERVFSRPGTYWLRARYLSARGELVTPEVKIKVSNPKNGDTVERDDFALRFPWEFKVGEPVNLQIADAMESCNSKDLLRDVQRLNDYMTTGKIDGQPIPLGEFLKWIDKQNVVRRECLLIPMGHACVRNLDLEALREVVKRLPDRSDSSPEFKARLEQLEKLVR